MISIVYCVSRVLNADLLFQVSKQFAFPTAIAALSSCSASSKSLPSRNPLPIAYHVLQRPLPYQVGLELQNAIIQARLQAKKEDPSSDLALQDVILLLGKFARVFWLISMCIDRLHPQSICRHTRQGDVTLWSEISIPRSRRFKMSVRSSMLPNAADRSPTTDLVN